MFDVFDVFFADISLECKLIQNGLNCFNAVQGDWNVWTDHVFTYYQVMTSLILEGSQPKSGRTVPSIHSVGWAAWQMQIQRRRILPQHRERERTHPQKHQKRRKKAQTGLPGGSLLVRVKTQRRQESSQQLQNPSRMVLSVPVGVLQTHQSAIHLATRGSHCFQFCGVQFSMMYLSNFFVISYDMMIWWWWCSLTMHIFVVMKAHFWEQDREKMNNCSWTPPSLELLTTVIIWRVWCFSCMLLFVLLTFPWNASCFKMV